VLVTSHILGEIERVADRVAILLGGRLLGVHSLRAGALGERFRLRVRGRPDAVRAALTEVPGVRGVTIDAGATSDLAAYLVDAEARSGVSEALASSIVAGGFGLLEMGPAPVDLEALFLGLTGGHSGERA
jgi:ABC-2 type transport system ATP-binding protein